MSDAKKLYVCTSVSSDSNHLFDGLTGGTGVYLDSEELKVPCSGTDDHYKLILFSIEYDIRLYSPGFLDLKFSLATEGSPSEKPYPLIRDYYLGCPVDMFGYNLDSSNKAEGADKITILENYFVQDIQFQKQSKDATVCRFICRSMDYKLTQEIGCEVFTGKKLAGDILKDAVDRLNQVSSMLMKYDASCGRLLLLGYDSDRKVRDGMHKSVVDAVAHKEEMVAGHTDELIQPYLVRYNESIYDFLVRVAHRCGEFLFFDEGKLCIGLPDSTVKHIVEGNDTTVPDCSQFLCSYPEIAAVPEEPTTFSADYVKGVISAAASAEYLDLQHSSDENLHHLTAGDDLTSADLKGKWIIDNSFATFFTSDNFLDGVVDALFLLVAQVIRTTVVVPHMLGDKYKKYVEEGTEFSTDITDNLYNAFYHTIEYLEGRAEREKVLLDFGSSIQKYHIGDDIDLKDGLHNGYVIVRKYGSVSIEGTHHKAEAVPVFVGNDKCPVGSLKRVVVPPMGDISHSRQVRPLEAVVKKTDDPLRLNRVRVKYFWQTDDTLSPWIRVVVPYAGGEDSSGGCAMMLEEGEHVVLNYINGNIERPYVNGSSYFRYKEDGKVLPCSPEQGWHDNEPRYYVPMHPVRSIVSGNGHSLKFKDVEDTSLIGSAFPLANTFYSILMTDKYKTSREFQNIPFGVVKGGGLTLSDASELCSMDINADKRSVDIRSNFGTVKTTAFTGITINVPNGDIKIKGKNVSIEAGNNLILSSGTNIRKRKVRKADVAGVLTGNLLMNSLTREARSGIGVNLKNALDLTFARCCLEIILRPIEGSLILRSGRNMTVTAGRGRVKIPRSLMSNAYKNKLVTKKLDVATSYDFSSIPVVMAIKTVFLYINGFYMSAKDKYEAILGSVKQFKQLIGTGHDLSEDADTNYIKPSEVEIINNAADKPNQQFVKFDAFFANNDFRNMRKYKKLEKAYKVVLSKVKEYRTGILELGLLKKRLENLRSIYGYSVDINQFPDGYRQPFAIPGTDKRIWGYSPDVEKSGEIDGYKKIMQGMIRSAILQIILQCKSVQLIKGENENGHLGDSGIPPERRQYITDIRQLDNYVTSPTEYKWCEVARALADVLGFPKFPNGRVIFAGSMVNAIASTLGGGVNFSPVTGEWKLMPGYQKLRNINGASGPRAFSEISSKGNIFFSNSPGSSVTINELHSGWNGSPNGDARAIADALLGLDK